MDEYEFFQIERLVYIWGRYEGMRVPNGKIYTRSDILELVRRLKRFAADINSFDEGFEKEGKG